LHYYMDSSGGSMAKQLIVQEKWDSLPLHGLVKSLQMWMPLLRWIALFHMSGMSVVGGRSLIQLPFRLFNPNA
jgi:hypothetical protein